MKYGLLLLGILCVGCGGSGGGGPASTHWVGTWGAVGPNIIPPPGESGTLDIHIDAEGNVTGTCFNEGKNETAVVSGKMTVSQVNLTFNYPTSLDWSGHPAAPPDALGFSPSSIAGNIIIETEEYNRTLHGYLTKINLNQVP